MKNSKIINDKLKLQNLQKKLIKTLKSNSRGNLNSEFYFNFKEEDTLAKEVDAEFLFNMFEIYQESNSKIIQNLIAENNVK
jgi:hypothetical protein